LRWSVSGYASLQPGSRLHCTSEVRRGPNSVIWRCRLNVRFAESGQSIRVLAMSLKCHLLPDAPQPTASLLDYLIGARRQTRWHLDAERLGGLEIDHELELGQLLDWQIGGLISLECGQYRHRLGDMPRRD
jgi:hypothetical protein